MIFLLFSHNLLCGKSIKYFGRGLNPDFPSLNLAMTYIFQWTVRQKCCFEHVFYWSFEKSLLRYWQKPLLNINGTMFTTVLKHINFITKWFSYFARNFILVIRYILSHQKSKIIVTVIFKKKKYNTTIFKFWSRQRYKVLKPYCILKEPTPESNKTIKFQSLCKPS